MKLITYVCLLAMTLLSIQSYAVTTNPTPPSEEYITVGEYVNLKFKDIKERSATKLNIKDRVEFMVTKKRLKKQLKKGTISAETTLKVDDQFQIDWGGFALGFLLGLIGLIIVAIAWKKPKKNGVVSALIGMVAIAALYIIFV